MKIHSPKPKQVDSDGEKVTRGTLVSKEWLSKPTGPLFQAPSRWSLVNVLALVRQQKLLHLPTQMFYRLSTPRIRSDIAPLFQGFPFISILTECCMLSSYLHNFKNRDTNHLPLWKICNAILLKPQEFLHFPQYLVFCKETTSIFGFGPEPLIICPTCVLVASKLNQKERSAIFICKPTISYCMSLI